MRLKSKSIAILLYVLLPLYVFSQDIKISIPDNQVIRYYAETSVPAFYSVNGTKNISTTEALDFIRSEFKIENNLSFRYIKDEVDNLGIRHLKYQQIYLSTPIEFSVYQIHEKNGEVLSFNGVAFNQISIGNSVIINENEALNTALDLVGASTYMWEFPDEEKNLKEFLENTEATYFPKGELVLINSSQDFKSPKLRYAWKFNIYAKEPLSRADYYVDAENGQILFINHKIHHEDVDGTAVTKFSGTRNIIADRITADSFRLRESGRGKGIETYNMKNGTSYSAAVDFYDKDNYWNNVNAKKDEIATDAHWGTEMTYDYYKNVHGRNSIDNNGFRLRSYLHYSNNYANAFWNGQYMTYGDGSSSMQPFVAMDVIAHEITHGLTSFTADLVYSSESGALNEGFSDIFGNMVEKYAKPTDASWEMGSDIGYVIRDQQNPNATGNPDTYGGGFWQNTKGCVPSQQNDNCGVHQNSTVHSYWFYLLAMGGTGKNDINNNFNVEAIGTDNAAAIAFRALTVYLPASSNFEDARFYTARAAADLYGECSKQVESVLKAWYAVGIGLDGGKANFIASNNTSCAAPFHVQFQNKSDVFTKFNWDFGDGNSSAQENPIHTYNSTGKYTVKLIASNTCKADTITKTDFITIDNSLPCIFYMPSTSKTDSSNLCRGTLYDNGGTSNYTGNLESYFTISVPGTSNITLEFISFEFEDCPEGCDFLYVYDGYGPTAPLIGKYSGFNSPGIITSTGNAITIRQSTDPMLTFSGFEIKWYCSDSNQPPKADFKYKVENKCDGIAEFQSLGFNNPTSWQWDFGDGQSSTLRNPVHEYKESGIYSVKHICKSSKGIDSITKANIIEINRPVAPMALPDSSCGPDSFVLTANQASHVKWFDKGNNLIHSGSSYNTGTMYKSDTFFIMTDFGSESQFVGPKSNAFGNGAMFSGNQSLIFNVYKKVELKSVKVYANGKKTRAIQLRNKEGVTLQEAFIEIPDGESRIELNFLIEPGNDYRLGTGPSPAMYRNSTNAVYPYKIDDLISITGTTASQAGYYYFFYDWEMVEPPCNSAKTPVMVWIDTIPDADFSFDMKQQNLSFYNKSVSGRNFKWDFGDGQTSLEENPVHYYSKTGNYDVTLSISNTCGTDFIKKSILVVQSVKDNTFANDFNVYPNPVKNELNMVFDNNSNELANISVVNLLGKEVFSKNIAEKGMVSMKIDTEQFTDGIYMIRLFIDNQIKTKTIVIQK